MVQTVIKENMFAQFEYNGKQRLVVFVEDEVTPSFPITGYDFVCGGFRRFYKEDMKNFRIVSGYVAKASGRDSLVRSTPKVLVKFDPKKNKIYAVMRDLAGV